MRIHLLKPDQVAPGRWYGVSRYTTEMVKAMKQIDPSLEFVTFQFSLRGRVSGERRRALEHAGVDVISARLPNLTRLEIYNRFIERNVIPGLIERHRFDISWGTNCVALRSTGRGFRSVVTIHDLFLVTHPELSEGYFARRVGPRLRETIRQVDLVLTDSFFTRGQIVELLSVDETKVVVTHLGVSDSLMAETPETAGTVTKPAGGNHPWALAGEPGSDAEAAAVPLAKLGLDEPPILSVGTVEPRKNYEAGLEAYRSLRHRMGRVPPWVIVGRDGWKFENFYTTRERMGLQKEVHVCNDIDDRQLATLYRQARCLFCPSLVEGFGLPVLEAMHAGLPVVCSTGGALPEVGGEAVLTFDPHDIAGMAGGLERVVTDADSAAELVRRGRERAKQFSWHKAAATALGAFRKLVSG